MPDETADVPLASVASVAGVTDPPPPSPTDTLARWRRVAGGLAVALAVSLLVNAVLLVRGKGRNKSQPGGINESGFPVSLSGDILDQIASHAWWRGKTQSREWVQNLVNEVASMPGNHVLLVNERGDSRFAKVTEFFHFKPGRGEGADRIFNPARQNDSLHYLTGYPGFDKRIFFIQMDISQKDVPETILQAMQYAERWGPGQTND